MQRDSAMSEVEQSYAIEQRPGCLWGAEKPLFHSLGCVKFHNNGNQQNREQLRLHRPEAGQCWSLDIFSLCFVPS